MKNARTSRALRVLLAAAVALVASLGAFACWQLAPSGGTIDNDAAVAPVPEGGSLFADSSASSDATLEAATDEDGAASDAGIDTGPGVLPQPSTTLAEGVGFACSIDGAGNVWCWGDDSFEQAGAPRSAVVAHPNQVTGVSSAIAIALGDYHACAVTTTNAVYCWGLNASDQLAHLDDAGVLDDICQGAVAGQNVPCNATATLADVPPAVAIAAAGAWTCTVGTDGTVTCWGAVQTGYTVSDSVPCGAGTAAQGGNCYPAPYAVGVGGVKQLAVAFDHACALAPSDGGGVVTCWGNNNAGQVWPHSCLAGCGPEQPGLPLSASVAAGNAFTCALVDDGGTVTCFGDNQYGELGQTPPPDASGVFNSTPTTVAGLGAVSELVAAGNEAACALVDGGTVECWGKVAFSSTAGVPVAIPGLPPLLSLGVPDDSFACGATADGGIWCWYLVDGGGPALVQ